ncbi:MAG: cytochrome c [Terriglobales bacterium]
MRHLRVVIAVFSATVVVLSATRVAADTGTQIFDKHCAKCHGADGRAKTEAAIKMKVSNLRSGDVQGLSDAQLYDSVAYGKKHKQYPHAYLYKGLTERDIRAVVAHIRTFK